MKLLVDGYNLLHASGVFGHPSDPPTFETARRALLDLLAQQLTEKDRKQTTVVFDGKDAPPGLPSQLSFERISVLFSRRKTTADELIADLIAAEKQPRQLLVISSDHAVQRAARQRGVAHQDSELWIRDLRQQAAAATSTTENRDHPQSAEDIAHWVKEFAPPPAANRNKPPAGK
ncbi:YacP-like NYN domain protein [Anatilimnocola aggregata]|uniref:YacP-like NYN domain protein n=1 Tax=Anatilimnocola aggregata TaxID=2528021 RepID=A0A517YHY8_9BACT|nr:NYN domain-containing protein [Anatilimnocola aggregata]QDU29824.1 YacP-like NYN domain protein [Anatilimnocola aggregata]